MGTQFDEAFGQIVIPDLAKLCRVNGSLLALERRSFSDAFEAVMGEAIRRGAHRLTLAGLDSLHDWIMKKLLAHEAEFRPSVLDQRRIADKVALDIERTERRWADILAAGQTNTWPGRPRP